MTKPSSASGVTFRPLDDLFEPTDGSAERPQLAELDVESLVPFKDHPFREYPEEKMQEIASCCGKLISINRKFDKETVHG